MVRHSNREMYICHGTTWNQTRQKTQYARLEFSSHFTQFSYRSESRAGSRTPPGSECHPGRRKENNQPKKKGKHKQQKEHGIESRHVDFSPLPSPLSLTFAIGPSIVGLQKGRCTSATGRPNGRPLMRVGLSDSNRA